MGATGFEPVTPSVSSKGRRAAGGAGKGVTPTDADGCTTGCTDEARNLETDPVATIAAALLGLTPADRARLAALLMASQPGQPEGMK
jgi:hypothetical protein